MSRRFSLPAALAVLVAFSACGGSELRRSAFATRAEAAGVVPKWVPAASTNLETQVEEGTGAFWLRFRLSAADRAALEPELLRIPDSQVATLTFRAPNGSDWWFRGLVQVVPDRESTVIAADVFSGAGRAVPQGTFVAFERGSDAVYAWSAGR